MAQGDKPVKEFRAGPGQRREGDGLSDAALAFSRYAR
jgi:hypothetical protein